MAEDLLARVAAGDGAAAAQAARAFGPADRETQGAFLNRLAVAARTSPPCLDLLLALIDTHGLDRPAIRRVLVDTDQADDAHQDVLIVVAQSIGRFEGRSAFTTWLHSVARFTAIDHLRRRRDTVPFDETRPGGGGGRGPEPGPVVGAGSLGPSERLSSMIASRSDLLRAIHALPDAYRDAVVQRDLEQRSYAEIAERLGVEMNTVKSRIARGRALVAGMVREQLPELVPFEGGGAGRPGS